MDFMNFILTGNDAKFEALGIEAAVAGDTEMANLCQAAIEGDEEAIKICLEVIEENAMMDDD